MTDTLTLLSVISFLLAGVFGTASIVLWLQFDIPKIIGDLSGKAARRSVRKTRHLNERTAGSETEQLNNMIIIHTDEVIREGDETET